MNLYLRLLIVFLRKIGHPRLHYADATESAFRVLPHDLDALGHMNNGRYLQIMDVARAEWMLATGVAGAIRANRWAPLLGGSVIRYRHSLKLFQRYRVRTRLLAWDHRWFYLEHSFIDSNERCVAAGMTRAALHSGDGWVHADEVAEKVHSGARSPGIPAHIRDWVRFEESMFNFVAERRSGESRPVNFRRAC